MEKRFTGEGKEIITRCCVCPDFLNGNEIIKTESELVEISEKLDNKVAVLSHTYCNQCMCLLYPDWCKEQ